MIAIFNDKEVVFQGHAGDELDLFRGVHRPGGVARVAAEDGAGPAVDLARDLPFVGEVIPVLKVGRHRHQVDPEH